MADHASQGSVHHGQAKMRTGEKLRLRVKRQSRPGAEVRWEEFEVEYKPGMNVISCLMEIQRRPVTVQGETTTPIVWDANCLEEVCGSCAMNINGRVRMACSALVDKLEQPITLEPMTKFPLVRDLAVDRSFLFDSLKRLKAWIPIDGSYALGPGPKQSAADQQTMYVLSTCMTCACCLEACPQVNESSKFIGAAPISQVRLFNMHPTGKMNAHERLRELMGPGGVQDCGKAQNCVQVCPKNIPLTSSIAAMDRAATLLSIKDFFVGAEDEQEKSVE